MKRLADFSAEQQAAMPYPSLCALRRAAYTAHVAAMAVDPRIQAWASRMVDGHGPRVAVWFNGFDGVRTDHASALGWIEALLVVRYGEEPKHWPAEFTEQDIRRAEGWEAGTDRPAGVRYVTVEG